MKKLILSTTFLLAGIAGVLAQGRVQFDNGDWNFTDGIDRFVYTDAVGGTKVSDPTWQAGLFENGVQLGALCSFDFDPGADVVVIPGIWSWDGADRLVSKAAGNTAASDTSLQVRIFDGTGRLLGQSDPFTYRNAISDPPAPGDVLMMNFRAFVVPEPSTIALGVLGLGALLLFRRRK